MLRRNLQQIVMPVPVDMRVVNVSRIDNENISLLQFIRRLIDVRCHCPVLHTDHFQMLMPVCRQQFIGRVDLRKIELHQPVIGYNLMFPLLHSRSLSFLLSPCFSHARFLFLPSYLQTEKISISTHISAKIRSITNKIICL